MSRHNQVGTHKTKVLHENNTITVRYHNTDVVEVNPYNITLNTGGWFTNTTKLRMNQASNQFNLGFQVYQRNHQWFVDYRGETIAYEGSTLVLGRGIQ